MINPNWSNQMHLGDFQLRPLDPQLAADILALRSGTPSPRLRSLLLYPNWRMFEQPTLERLLRTPPPVTPSQPLVPRGDGPARPRAADVGDLMQAIWKVPAVHSAGTRLLDQLSSEMQRDWSHASSGDKALVVSSSAVALGGSLAAVLSNNQARTAAFQLVVNKDIPVPRVDGLTVRLLPQGVMFTFDVTRYVRSLK